MTCVVAYTDGKKIYMAADTAGTGSTFTSKNLQTKIFPKDEYAIGYCGSYRLGQILHYSFAPPLPGKKLPKDEILGFMVTEFIPALKECLAESGYPEHKEDKRNVSLLVGLRGQIFEIEYSFQVDAWDVPYMAVGSGTYYALGAMHAVSDTNEPEHIVRAGLAAAARFDPNVNSEVEMIVV